MPSETEVLIRLKGTPKNVECIAKKIKEVLDITAESDNRHNDRHDPKLASKYLTAEVPDENSDNPR